MNTPCWESGILASYRSQSGDTFLPSFLSSSPCRKNSSHSLSVHSMWWSHGFPGWEMSAICTRKLNSMDRSDPSSLAELYNASYIDQWHDYSIRRMAVAYASCPDRISFSCFIWSKWKVMSVANTMSTIVLRTWEYCSEVKPLSTFESSCEGGERERVHAIHQQGCSYSPLLWSWKCSRGDDFPELIGHCTTWHTLFCKRHSKIDIQ